MSSQLNPIPSNEFERLISLSDFDLDYSNLNEHFKDLTELAARVSDSEISVVNLIDSYTTWSISSFGLENISQTPREESTCQYTIMNNDFFEVENLTLDDRLRDKAFVNPPLSLRYYFGLPLTTVEGSNIGALCVLDRNVRKLSPEKIELLRLIANEIVNRLNTIKVVKELKNRLTDSNQNNFKIAHDIRGPLSGIIGIAEVISERGDKNQLNDLLDLINMIQKSSKSLLTLADEILTTDYQKNSALSNDEFNLSVLQEKLDVLYRPQARNKDIYFNVKISSANHQIPFAKNKLLQIAGNLISNAIKFTPVAGIVTVDLELKIELASKNLIIAVSDTGPGLSVDAIHMILYGEKNSSSGSNGEQGYGFGLLMVKHLIDVLKGKLEIDSDGQKGTRFIVTLPIT